MTPWTAARQASLSVTNSQSLLKFMYTKLVMLSNQMIDSISVSFVDHDGYSISSKGFLSAVADIMVI